MTVKKANSENEIYVIGVDMDNRSPEAIAKDAALQIVELFDKIAQERREKDDKNVTKTK